MSNTKNTVLKQLFHISKMNFIVIIIFSISVSRFHSNLNKLSLTSSSISFVIVNSASSLR